MEPQKKYWNIDEATGELLQALIHTHKPKNILEIGTSNGYSAICMGRIAKNYGGHITTIEFFEERVNLARENIETEELSKTIEVVQGDATEILQSLATGKRLGLTVKTPSVEEARESFDFIFLDANKAEYALYFQHAMRIITLGGIIVADNTISHAKKLTEFFAAVQNEPRARTLPLTIGTGLMIIKIS